MIDEPLLDDILALFHDEDLIRFRRRAEKRELKLLADMFSAEIELRNQRERPVRQKAVTEPPSLTQG